jgi:hypothetical protein
MDLALSSRTTGQTERPSKRSRATGGTSALSLEEVARLSLATSAGLKIVKSACIRTVLLPLEDQYVAAAKKAGQDYNEHQKRKDAKPLHAFVVVGQALLKTMAQDEAVPAGDHQIVQELMTKITEYGDLYEVFRVCHMSKCHDGIQARIEFSLTPEFCKLSAALAHAMATSAKKSECYGPAPRMPLDRSIGAALSQPKV